MSKGTEKIWAQRVAAWRASGQSSEVFSRGRDFTAGGLRHWAYRLRRRRGSPPGAGAGEAKPQAAVTTRARQTAPLRLARVTVARPAAAAAPGRDGVARPTPASGVTLEVGAVRVTLAPRFDRETLAAVLAVLDTTGGAR